LSIANVRDLNIVKAKVTPAGVAALQKGAASLQDHLRRSDKK
jgi:hypothetical protein